MSALLNGRSQANALPPTSQVLLVFLYLSTPSVTSGSPAARRATSSKVCTPKTVRPRLRWDVAFAGLYLDALRAALAGSRPTRPWDVAFGAPAGLPPLRYVLPGMNAHINYDLPQALLAVITDEEFDDPALLTRRRSDHQAIDHVLASRVAAEDDRAMALTRPP
jgi:hypothetical protein